MSENPVSQEKQHAILQARKVIIPITTETPKSVQYDLNSLLEEIGERKIVCIGSSTPGTREFFEIRAEISERLIKEKNFSFIACETCWPDTLKVNRFVRGFQQNESSTTPLQTKSESLSEGTASLPCSSSSKTSITDSSHNDLTLTGADLEKANDALSDFTRYPRWVWRNESIAKFITWLRRYNSNTLKKDKQPVGFYGLDLYSLQEAREAVIDYLQSVDPQLAQKARVYYTCFDRFLQQQSFDCQSYACSGIGLTPSCEKEVEQIMKDLQQKMIQKYQSNQSVSEFDRLFFAQISAQVVRNAEEYYRKMFFGTRVVWNIREESMVGILDQLILYYNTKHPDNACKAIIWSHNSHAGDSDGTEGKKYGEKTMGNLIRNKYGSDQTFIIGLTTYQGEILSSNEWGTNPQVMKLVPAVKESHEYLFHCISSDPFMILFRDAQNNHPKDKSCDEKDSNNQKVVQEMFDQDRLERTIGVIYSQDSEINSHYFTCNIRKQFDAVIHVDMSHAVNSLDHLSTLGIQNQMT